MVAQTSGSVAGGGSRCDGTSQSAMCRRLTGSLLVRVAEVEQVFPVLNTFALWANFGVVLVGYIFYISCYCCY